MGYLEKVFNSAYISEDTPNDKIILIPKGIKEGIEYNLLLSKSDFDLAIATVRRTEPMAEPILISLVQNNNDSKTNSYKAFLSSNNLIDIYRKKQTQYLECIVNKNEQEVEMNTQLETMQPFDDNVNFNMMQAASEFCNNNQSDVDKRNTVSASTNLNTDISIDPFSSSEKEESCASPSIQNNNDCVENSLGVESLKSLMDSVTETNIEKDKDSDTDTNANADSDTQQNKINEDLSQAYTDAIIKFELDMKSLSDSALLDFYVRLPEYINDNNCLMDMSSIIHKTLIKSNNTKILSLLLSNAIDPNVNGNEVFCEALVIVCKYLISVSEYEDIETLFTPISTVLYGS